MSDTPTNTAGIIARLNKLGFACESLTKTKLDSAVAALACFPMYMVANLHGWTKDIQWEIPWVDIPGFEAIREAWAIGREEKQFEITKEHRQSLGTLLKGTKPSDLIIYEYALDTLLMVFEFLDPPLVSQMKTAISRMMLNVANASGEGLLGTGEKLNRHEVQCIEEITEKLQLRQSSDAAQVLKALEI